MIRSKVEFAVMLLWVLLISCQEDAQEPTPPTVRKVAYYTNTYLEKGSAHSQSKTSFEYDANGKLSRYVVYSFDDKQQDFFEERHFLFVYVDEKVDAIRGYQPNHDDAYVEYSYQYLPDGKVSLIKEDNYDLGTSSAAKFTYAMDFVTVTYSFSNGNNFDYKFQLNQNNIVTDEVKKGGSVCSTGTYSYDNMINPLHTLGYVDYLLFNVSGNNKLYEDVDYIACAFPTLIPEMHVYEYDDEGFPILAVTTYKGSSLVSRKDYFYVDVP